jgi:predicted transcriptional regulator
MYYNKAGGVLMLIVPIDFENEIKRESHDTGKTAKEILKNLLADYFSKKSSTTINDGWIQNVYKIADKMQLKSNGKWSREELYRDM